MADESQVAAMFDETKRLYGGVDVVVNTAGIMILAPLADLSLDDFDRQIRTTFAVPSWSARTPRVTCAQAEP